MKALLLGSVLSLLLVSLLGCKPNDTFRVEGKASDPLIRTRENDPELAAAVAEAKRTVSKFVEAYQKKGKGDDVFLIKKGFPATVGQLEHIWIEVQSYDGSTFTGKVGNDPYNVPGLKKDDVVKVKPSEATDWLYVKDGKTIGGMAEQVLAKRSEKK